MRQEKIKYFITSCLLIILNTSYALAAYYPDNYSIVNPSVKYNGYNISYSVSKLSDSDKVYYYVKRGSTITIQRAYIDGQTWANFIQRHNAESSKIHAYRGTSASGTQLTDQEIDVGFFALVISQPVLTVKIDSDANLDFPSGWTEGYHLVVTSQAGVIHALRASSYDCRLTLVRYKFAINYNLEGGSNGPSNWGSNWTDDNFSYDSAYTSDNISNPSQRPIVSSTIPTKVGYSFLGWYSSSTGGTKYNPGQVTIAGILNDTATLNLYAQWAPTTYTATFDYNGGSGSPASQTFNIEGSLSMPVTPTRAGYTFAGWKVTTAAGNWSSGTTYSAGASVGTGKYGNVTFTAQWTPITYNISFNGNGSTSGSMSNMTGLYFGNDVTLTSNSFSRQYTVTYDANGGTCSKSSENCAYSFNGWEDRGSITYNGTTYSYTQFDAPYYANHYNEVYSLFKYDKYLLLHHYVNWGKGEGRTCVGSTHGTYPNNAVVKNLTTDNGVTVPLYAQWTPQSVTLPSPTRTGYVFNGWYTQASGGTKIGDGGTSYTPTADVTLHAQWTEFDKGNLTVTVTGLANNDSAICTVVSSVDGSRYVLSLTAAKNSATIKDIYIGEYTVSTGGWQWNYTLSGTSSRSATLTKGATSTVTFNLSTKADTPKHDSHYKENILK